MLISLSALSPDQCSALSPTRPFAYQSSHRPLPFSNKSASLARDTVSIKHTHTHTHKLPDCCSHGRPSETAVWGQMLNSHAFFFPPFPLFLNKDANPLLWLQPWARRSKNKSEKQTSWCQAEGFSVQQTKHYCFLLHRPPESGTGSALADSVMQINSEDNTVCSNLFSSASERVWGLRMYEWRNWTRRMRVKSICWLKYINAFAQHMWIFCNNKQNQKKKKNRPKIGRERTAFLDILLCKSTGSQYLFKWCWGGGRENEARAPDEL